MKFINLTIPIDSAYITKEQIGNDIRVKWTENGYWSQFSGNKNEMKISRRNNEWQQ